MRYFLYFVATAFVVAVPWFLAEILPSTALVVLTLIASVSVPSSFFYLCTTCKPEYVHFMGVWVILALIAAPLPFLTEKYGVAIYALVASLPFLGVYMFHLMENGTRRPAQRYEQLVADEASYRRLLGELLRVSDAAFTLQTRAQYEQAFDDVEHARLKCPASYRTMLNKRCKLVNSRLELAMKEKGL